MPKRASPLFYSGQDCPIIIRPFFPIQTEITQHPLPRTRHNRRTPLCPIPNTPGFAFRPRTYPGRRRPLRKTTRFGRRSIESKSTAFSGHTRFGRDYDTVLSQPSPRRASGQTSTAESTYRSLPCSLHPRILSTPSSPPEHPGQQGLSDHTSNSTYPAE